ncbi:hypothetical protein C2S52_003330 [Perilla frutescens var. hirtella]|nr:hypothetical protein C2S52_003330 [Perilla frutescens var. hirtella]
MDRSLTWFSRVIWHHHGVSARKWQKEAMKVMWEKPEIGWTKLNYDGSCKWKTGKCSIGGVFRDEKAAFLLGYAESISSSSSSSIAELAALLRGLEIALQNGWTHLCLEGDSKSLIDIISQKRHPNSKCQLLHTHLQRINFIIPQFSNCILTHTYRQGNRAADKFAQMGHALNKPHIWRHIPPNQLLRVLQQDAQGKTFLRTR